MARKKTVRKVHSVKANMQVMELTRAGSAIDFEIFAGKEKIGRITIGHGSFSWFGKSKVNPTRFSWTEFADMMDEICYSK